MMRCLAVDVILLRALAPGVICLPSCCLGVFNYTLPSSGWSIVARVGSRGNMFTELLPSNGYTRHNMFIFNSNLLQTLPPFFNVDFCRKM
jgi:hypothetical protein